MSFVRRGPEDLIVVELPGGGTARSLFAPEEAERLSVHLLEIPPGSRAPPTRHRVASELLYVLEGEAEFEIGGEVRTGRAGDFLRIPPGAVHALRTGERGVRFLAIECPPVSREHDFEFVDGEE